jgi:hypothetical protein
MYTACPSDLYLSVFIGEDFDLLLIDIQICDQFMSEFRLDIQQSGLQNSSLLLQFPPHIAKRVHPVYVLLRHLNLVLLHQIVALLHRDKIRN